MKFLVNVDFSQNQLLNAVLHTLAGAPSSPVKGQEYFNTSNNTTFVWNGTAWRPYDAAALTDGSIQMAALAVNPLARANHTGTQLASTISDLSTVVKGYSLDMFAAPGASLNFGGYRGLNIGAATTGTDIAQWAQVQTLVAQSIAGQNAIKNPVKAVATGNITLSGTQTIDGVAVAVGDRVLTTAQASTANNNIWVVAAGAWALASDVSGAGALIEGTEVLVNEGTTYPGTIWRMTATGTITPGTTPLSWVQTTKINTYSADGTTLILTGTVFSAKLGSGLTSGAGGIQIDTSVVARAVSGTINGDGATTSFTFTHSLGKNCTIQVFDSSGNLVQPDIQRTSLNAAAIIFATAPNGSTSYGVTATG